MRRAFELAFATAYLFCGTKPSFLEVDEVTFRRPVEIGNLLQFESRCAPNTAFLRRPCEARVCAVCVFVNASAVLGPLWCWYWRGIVGGSTAQLSVMAGACVCVRTLPKE